MLGKNDDIHTPILFLLHSYFIGKVRERQNLQIKCLNLFTDTFSEF